METQTTESNTVDIKANKHFEGQVYPLNSTSQTKSDPSELTDKKEEHSSVSSVYLEPEEEKEQTSEEKEQSPEQKDAKTASSKKKYHNIPNDIRIKLIDAVENKGEKIKHAAKRLAINYSSAKSICQVFKREGRTKKKLIKKRPNNDDPNSDYQEVGGRFLPFNQGDSNFTINQQMYKKELDQVNDSTDTLTKLKNRLLQSRNNTNEEREDFPPYKKLHQGIEDASNLMSNEAKQLQQLDRIIAQNNQILTSRASTTPSVNLQNNTSNITISSTSNSYNGPNVNISGPPTQLITIAPNSNAYHPQIIQQSSNSTNVNQFRGFVIANPQTTNVRQQIQGQQQIFVAPNSGGQMQLVFNPMQNSASYPQQQGFVNFGAPYQQPNNGEVMVMMNAPNHQNGQPSYMASLGGNTPQQQPQVVLQTPQYISMVPSPQQIGGYPQVQTQQMNGFTQIQPQQISGFTTVQPQQISGYSPMQPQIGGFPQMQQPIVYMLPAGGNFVTQNITSSQGYGYTVDSNAQINLQISNNTQQTNISAGGQSNEIDESKNDNFIRFSRNPAQILNFANKIIEKKEYAEPTGNATKKVIFDEVQRPRLTSDLLNELKTNNTNHIGEKRLGLKVLTQGEKTE